MSDKLEIRVTYTGKPEDEPKPQSCIWVFPDGYIGVAVTISAPTDWTEEEYLLGVKHELT
jgi:hypothetical protein